MDTEHFYACLANRERRRLLALFAKEPELCVCELVGATLLPQPRISRHLAMLRKAELLVFRRSGTWLFYRLSPKMPLWAFRTLEMMLDAEADSAECADDHYRLKARPVRYAEADQSSGN
jgi:ArsR family transcriptional regulator